MQNKITIDLYLGKEILQEMRALIESANDVFTGEEKELTFLKQRKLPALWNLYFMANNLVMENGVNQ